MGNQLSELKANMIEEFNAWCETTSGRKFLKYWGDDLDNPHWGFDQTLRTWGAIAFDLAKGKQAEPNSTQVTEMLDIMGGVFMGAKIMGFEIFNKENDESHE